MARICWGRSTGCFIYNFVIQVISEKTLCSKDLLKGILKGTYWKVFMLQVKDCYFQFHKTYYHEICTVATSWGASHLDVSFTSFIISLKSGYYGIFKSLIKLTKLNLYIECPSYHLTSCRKSTQSRLPQRKYLKSLIGMK